MKAFDHRKKRSGISIDFINAMIEKASPHRAPEQRTPKHYVVHVRTTENWLARGVVNANGIRVGYQIIDGRQTEYTAFERQPFELKAGDTANSPERKSPTLDAIYMTARDTRRRTLAQPSAHGKGGTP